VRKSEVGVGGDGAHLHISWPFYTPKPPYTSSIGPSIMDTANRIEPIGSGEPEKKGDR
jgi:hypothetical protein